MKALVLNASYEPLSVVPVRRAVVLVLRNRADVVVS
nr:HNH endonuclease [Acidimicrobiia bacterium]